MIRHRNHAPRRCQGYTLIEVLIASALSVLIVGAAIALFASTIRSWNGVKLRLSADSDVNLAMSRMIYGMGDRLGLRSAASSSVTLTPDGNNGWTLTYNTGGSTPQNNSFTYSASDKRLEFNPGSLLVGRDISSAMIGNTNGVLYIRLHVDKESGTQQAAREIVSAITFRN